MKFLLQCGIRKKLIHTAFLTISGLSITHEASAVEFTLDFEGVGNNAQILEFYNGGTDSQGNSGENLGISFGGNALGNVDLDAGGTGNFANEPTPDTTMFFLSGSAVLNYAPGFDTGFSFYYTTAFDANVTVYDGLNATGNVLGTINLFRNNVANNCSGDPQGGPGDPLGQFCNFDIASLALSETAMSIDFSGTVNQVGFDNVTFGSVNPSPVPVPGAALLFGSSLLGMLAVRRRKNL